MGKENFRERIGLGKKKACTGLSDSFSSFFSHHFFIIQHLEKKKGKKVKTYKPLLKLKVKGEHLILKKPKKWKKSKKLVKI